MWDQVLRRGSDVINAMKLLEPELQDTMRDVW